MSRGFVFLRESRILQTPMSVLPFPRARFRIHLLGEEVDAGGDESGHETLGHVVHGVLWVGEWVSGWVGGFGGEGGGVAE